MRSRSFLLHDSHLTCSINHQERADIRISKQIKSLRVVRLLSLALLLAFSVTACSSGKTKPRAMGIGLRYGSINDATMIEGRDGELYVEADQKVNYDATPMFPVFFQCSRALVALSRRPCEDESFNGFIRFFNVLGLGQHLQKALET